MGESLYKAYEWYLCYIGNGMHHILFLIAIGFLFIMRKDKKVNRVLISYFLILALIYICPITAMVIMKYCVGPEVYWRMFWLLPIPIIIAYAATVFCSKQKKKGMENVTILVIVLAIIFTGSNLYRSDAFVKSHNLQKLSQDTIGVCNMMQESKVDGEVIKTIVPDELITEIRQYDASIIMTYGRYGSTYPKGIRVYNAMHQDTVDPNELLTALREDGCNYLVYYKDQELNQALLNLGASNIGEVGNYAVYRVG